MTHGALTIMWPSVVYDRDRYRNKPLFINPFMLPPFQSVWILRNFTLTCEYSDFEWCISEMKPMILSHLQGARVGPNYPASKCSFPFLPSLATEDSFRQAEKNQFSHIPGLLWHGQSPFIAFESSFTNGRHCLLITHLSIHFQVFLVAVISICRCIVSMTVNASARAGDVADKVRSCTSLSSLLPVPVLALSPMLFFPSGLVAHSEILPPGHGDICPHFRPSLR